MLNLRPDVVCWALPKNQCCCAYHFFRCQYHRSENQRPGKLPVVTGKMFTTGWLASPRPSRHRRRLRLAGPRHPDRLIQVCLESPRCRPALGRVERGTAPHQVMRKAPRQRERIESVRDSGRAAHRIRLCDCGSGSVRALAGEALARLLLAEAPRSGEVVAVFVVPLLLVGAARQQRAWRRPGARRRAGVGARATSGRAAAASGGRAHSC